MAPRGAGARRRARGRDQHRLARGRRSPRRSATARASASRSPTRWKAATTAARSRPRAASPRRCRCSATRSGSSPADVYAPDFRFDAAATPSASPPATGSRTCGWSPNPPLPPARRLRPRRRRPRPGRRHRPRRPRWTYANIALFRAAMFGGVAPGTRPRCAAALRGMRAAAARRRGLSRPLGRTSAPSSGCARSGSGPSGRSARGPQPAVRRERLEVAVGVRSPRCMRFARLARRARRVSGLQSSKVLRSLGDGSKRTEAEGSGDSYGFGRSACSSNTVRHSASTASRALSSVAGGNWVGCSSSRAVCCARRNSR